ncbi:glycosyltransferase family 2 protein [Cognaticolwellia beringensis]|uniref:Glycosyltransferase family 2 protein n=1 Tax=Cognaticolwellia beringensis TaxID=1967665 RepID=A0A222G7X6_9GAMM|nr:glycosyltransferase family 2 protein [Cognaticolwellia beringensis]ASP47987.1 glycosyltransferase family 2 protein [Cognaticolwellia beringensis]
MTISIAVCSTQRTTLAQAIAFIKHYEKIGMEKIIIFFDDPDDENIKTIEGLKNVITIRCSDEYWETASGRSKSVEQRQMYNSDYALDLCQQLHIDWLLHVDVDEFIHFDNLKSAPGYFKNIPDNIVTIRFPVCESIPETQEHTNFWSEIKNFRSHPVDYKNSIKMPFYIKLRTKINLLMVKLKKSFLILTGNGRYLEYGYMKAYIAGKSATRVKANVKLMGLHVSNIIYKKNEFGTISNDACILHFDAFSYIAWHQKWLKRIDGRGTSTLMHNERYQQLLDFEKHYNSKDNDALKILYKEIYFIDKKGKFLLKKLGLIKAL